MSILLKSMSILVVDDNANMRRIISQILRALPVRRVTEAEDAVEALELLRKNAFDALIVDYRMQPLDGVEFTHLLRTAPDSPAPDIPVLMMTGHTERSRVLAAKQAGVSNFLAKPVSTRILLERLVASFESSPRAAARPPVAALNEDESLYLL